MFLSPPPHLLLRRSDSNDDDDDSTWLYNPSFALAVVATILYTIPMAGQLWLPCCRSGRQHRYFIVVLIGAVVEVAGYALRAASTKMLADLSTNATSQSLIVIAPILVAAGLYMMIARLIPAGLPLERQRIYSVTPRLLAKLFVTSDIISMLTQASGSGIAASNHWEGSTMKIGENVLIGGLALQVVTFSFFLFVVRGFHVRARAEARQDTDGWKKVVIGVYASGAFIWLIDGKIRCVYRLVEFACGIQGYPFTHEWMFYIFESIPMLAALSILCFYHPGRYLPSMTSPTKLAAGSQQQELGERHGRHHLQI